MAADERGDAELQFHVGLCFKSGQGVQKDRIKASEYLNMAARQGHLNAQEELERLQEIIQIKQREADRQMEEAMQRAEARKRAEAQKIEAKLRQIGLGGECDKFVTALNRGAEDAAKLSDAGALKSAEAEKKILEAELFSKGEYSPIVGKYLSLSRETLAMTEAKEIIFSFPPATEMFHFTG